MKCAAFEYSVPTTVDEAIAALAIDDSKVLAGGQSLIPVLAMRLGGFERLVDLRKIPELRGCTQNNGTVTIGAMTTHATVLGDASVVANVPMLGKALPFVGHFQIRNRGTVGGSMAHADPSSELPAVATALDATMVIAGRGGVRRVSASEFFLGTFTTAIEDGEILTAIDFPVWGPGSGFAVEEVARRHGDFALVGTVCGVRVDGGTIAQAAIAMFGVGSTPVRCGAAEARVVGAAVAGLDTAEIGRLAVQDLDPPEDVHASSEYRRHVGSTLVARALRNAIEEAGNA
jgi:carbon-monoxide dehydrogenase medium subunit